MFATRQQEIEAEITRREGVRARRVSLIKTLQSPLAAAQVDLAGQQAETARLQTEAAKSPYSAALRRPFIKESKEEELDKRQQILDVLQQEQKVVEQTQKTALQGIQQQIKERERMVEVARKEQMTFAERFVEMDPMQRSRLKAAVTKARAGKTLTRRELKDIELARGVTDIGEIVDRQFLESMARLGGLDITRGQFARRVAETEKDLATDQGIKREIQARINLNPLVEVTLKTNQKEYIDAIVFKVDELLVKTKEEITRALEDRLLQLEVQRNQEQNNNTMRNANRRVPSVN